MISNPKICYENRVTLRVIIERLYPNAKLIEIRDAFSEAIFNNILSRSNIDAIKRNTNKSGFYDGNIRRDGGKRSFIISTPTKMFRKALEEPTLYKNTYIQLIHNCKSILSDAEQVSQPFAADFFDFLNDSNSYSTELLHLIRQCVIKKKPESALALTVIIAIFQEKSPKIISANPALTQLLTAPVREKGFEFSEIYKAAAQVLEHAASEQGRMLAFDSVKNKMKIPGISSFGSTSTLDDSCSLLSLFENPPYENLLLIGCGGSGKTFALIDLGKRLIERDDKILPFFIPLYALNSKPADDTSPILNYFADTLASRCGIAPDSIISYLRSHSETAVLFLLDGYNELAPHSVKVNIIAEIIRLKREFKSIRFIITGRHDNSESFATGGELPFRTKQILPLDEETIQCYLYRQTKDHSLFSQLKNYSKNFIDILRNPMALTMYAYMNCSDFSNLTFNLSLPFPTPDTLGELLGNFVEQIKCTHALKGTPDIQSRTETVVKILYDIASKMSIQQKFKLTEQELKFFFFEAVQRYNTYESTKIPIDFYDRFMSTTRRAGFFICSRMSEWQYRFYHPIFRDYFYARFLLYTLRNAISLSPSDPDTAFERLCDVFDCAIADDILQMVGEIALEHHFLPNHKNRREGELSVVEQALQILRSRQNTPSAQRTVSTLIRIAQLARKGNMSTFHFDGLDLTGISLSGVSLYSVQDGRIFTASFRDARLNESVFLPNGHMAAVHTFSRVKNRILSISANAVWSYDIKTRSNQFVAPCNGTFVTVSAFSEKNHLLFTGDKNGWVRIWQHAEDSSGNISLHEYTDMTFNLSDIIRQFLIDEKRDLCLIGVKSNPICQFSIRHPERRQYITLCENILQKPKYKMILIDDFLYLASGLSVYKVRKNASEITENNLFMELEYEEAAAYIYDFKYMRTALDGFFIFNIRGTATSAIMVVSGTAHRTIKKMRHTPDWFGFNGITVSDYDPGFCICNNIGLSSHPAVTVVTYNTFRNDFICHDYYGTQNMEIADCCYVSKDEILFSSIDRSMQIINLCTESITARFPGYNPGLHNMQIYSPDTILACTYDGAFLRLQKSHMNGTWHCMQSKAAHTDWCNEICGFCIENALHAVICSNDGKVSVWNMETEELLFTICSDYGINSVCHLFGEYILAASRIGTITIYKMNIKNKSYTAVQSLYPCGRGATKAFLNFCAHLISADADSASLLVLAVSAAKTSRIYEMDIKTGDELSIDIREIFTRKNTRIRTLSSIFSAHTDHYIYMAAGTRFLSSDAEYLEIFSHTDTIAKRVNERGTEYKKLRCDTMTENIGFLSGTFFSYDGKLYIAAASYSHMLHIYKTDKGKLTEVNSIHLDFPAVDTKYKDDILYLTSLSGKLLAIPAKYILSGNMVPAALNDMHPDTIFQNLSGLYVNHVDLSDSHSVFSKEFREIIRRYQTRL